MTTATLPERHILTAARAAANIRVDGYTYTDTGRDFWMVHQDGQEKGRFWDKDQAERFADELWMDLVDAGLVGDAL